LDMVKMTITRKGFEVYFKATFKSVKKVFLFLSKLIIF